MDTIYEQQILKAKKNNALRIKIIRKYKAFNQAIKATKSTVEGKDIPDTIMVADEYTEEQWIAKGKPLFGSKDWPVLGSEYDTDEID